MRDHSERQLGLLSERPDQFRAALHRLQPPSSELAHLRECGRPQIGDLVLLQVRPDSLHRIEFRGIGRQERDGDLAFRASSHWRTWRLLWQLTPSQVTSSLRPIVRRSAPRNSMICSVFTEPLKKRNLTRHHDSPAIADICLHVKVCWMTEVCPRRPQVRVTGTSRTGQTRQ